MAVTLVSWDNSKVQGNMVITVAFTSDGDYSFLASRPLAMSLHGQGVFGGGTLSLQGGNISSNLYALPTAVSMVASGIASVARADLGYAYYNIHLTGSTNPNLTAYVSFFRNR